jgi:acetyl-CoA carboxylase biotin carboxylase subunit
MRVLDRALVPRGWAVECRITSEDPANGFLPGNGRIAYLRIPSGPGIRWDGGYELGDEVTLFYDSLLGKLIAWGGTRDEAIRRMRRALDELVVAGVATSLPFHRRLLADAAFARGEIDTQFLERRPDLARGQPDAATLRAVVVAAVLAEEEARGVRKPAVVADATAHSVWLAAARREGLR